VNVGLRALTGDVVARDGCGGLGLTEDLCWWYPGLEYEREERIREGMRGENGRTSFDLFTSDGQTDDDDVDGNGERVMTFSLLTLERRAEGRRGGSRVFGKL
jgi:hypothetical protein